MRPDLSVWQNDRVLSIIECKTQLGWNRDHWERDFLERENRLKADVPDAHAFLLVLTEGNWEGFDAHNQRFGRQYFVLLNKDAKLSDLDESNYSDMIVTPIEGLFAQIAPGRNAT
jgi:hypothetical protein